MEEQNNIPQVQEIDLNKISSKIRNNRKFIYKFTLIAGLIGIIIANSIPKEYTTQVTLASEVTKSSMGSSSMAALASLTGIGGSTNSRDALSPLIYPDIISSTPFIVELFDVPVKTIDGKIDTTLAEYLRYHQKKAWWKSLMALPSKSIRYIKNFLSSSSNNNQKEMKPANNNVNSFMLSGKDASIVGAIRRSISLDVDKKTAIISINVSMQDPLISATIADTVTAHLQKHITNYRTSKARVDLEFTEKLYNEAKEKYYSAQQEYADYIDKNQNLMFHRVQTQQERLRNEMQLAYTVYNQTAQQLQVAKAKVQENTPIYAVIQSASVPLAPSKPSKMLIIIGFMFLTAFATCIISIIKK